METKAVDLLKAPTDEEDRSALSGAKEFLLAELTDGPMTAKQVEKSAGDAGIRERTLRRAKSMLGIRSTKEADGSWTWSLPGKDAQDGQVPTDGSLGKVGNLASDKGAVILFFYRKMVKVAKPIRLDMLMATFEEPAVERPAATRGRERGGMSKGHRQHTLQSIYLRNRWCALDLAEHPPSKRELWVNQDKERFFFRHRRYPGGAAWA